MNDGFEAELRDESAPARDPILDEAFLQLRGLEPSAECRGLNRAVIADTLQRVATAHRLPTVPWWRKTIAVPVPVAAVAVILAAIALFSSLRSGQPQQKTQTINGAHTLPIARGNGVVASADVTKPTKTAGYFETETYLCGIGRLNSESGWQIPEENP